MRASSGIGEPDRFLGAMAGLVSGLAVPITWIPGLNWRWAIAAPLVLALLALILWAPQWRASHYRLDDTETPLPYDRPGFKPLAGKSRCSLHYTLSSSIRWSTGPQSYAAAHGISIETAGVYMLVYQVVAIATNLGSPSLIRHSQIRHGWA